MPATEAEGRLQGRGTPLTQHQDVYVEHHCLLVLGDGACPGPALLHVQPRQRESLATALAFTPWTFPLHGRAATRGGLHGQGQLLPLQQADVAAVAAAARVPLGSHCGRNRPPMSHTCYPPRGRKKPGNPEYLSITPAKTPEAEIPSLPLRQAFFPAFLAFPPSSGSSPSPHSSTSQVSSFPTVRRRPRPRPRPRPEA